jgi:hypothetical protein
VHDDVRAIGQDLGVGTSKAETFGDGDRGAYRGVRNG